MRVIISDTFLRYMTFSSTFPLPFFELFLGVCYSAINTIISFIPRAQIDNIRDNLTNNIKEKRQDQNQYGYVAKGQLEKTFLRFGYKETISINFRRFSLLENIFDATFENEVINFLEAASIKISKCLRDLPKTYFGEMIWSQIVPNKRDLQSDDYFGSSIRIGFSVNLKIPKNEDS